MVLVLGGFLFHNKFLWPFLKICYNDEKEEDFMTQEFNINPSDGVVRQYLTTSKTVAVVGLSDRGTTSNH